MNQQTYKYLCSDAENMLRSHQLMPALQSLRGLAVMLKQWDVNEEIETLVDSYQMMLDFMARGAADPGRAKMRSDFVRRAYELVTMLKRSGEIQENNTFYATSHLTLLNLKGPGVTLSEVLHSNPSARDLFDAVWLSPALTADDESTLSEMLMDDETIVVSKCLIVSAITLSALRYFDAAKYRILLNFALSNDVDVRARSLVGLLLVHIQHPQRVALYPDLVARLKLMLDQPGFVREVEKVQLELFLALETKDIERRMEKDIIPQMLDSIHKMHIDRSLGLDELNEKLSDGELNPEWMEENGEVDGKLQGMMRELFDITTSGADMYMATFRTMKSRFPFFSVACNWFWPFTLNHPELHLRDSALKTVNIIFESGGLCDSDKYSFCLMIQDAPANADLDDTFPNTMFKMGVYGGDTDETAFRKKVRSYVQDLYRFHNLFTYHNQFDNPFQQNLLILEHAPFNELYSNVELLERLAKFLFKEKLYGMALEVFSHIASNKDVEPSAEVWQKYGFCSEMAGQKSVACSCYEKAELLKPNSSWTLRRLAQCYRSLGNFQEALGCYEKLSEILPDDAGIALRRADCLIHLKSYDEAFKYLFKANYLDPESGQSERALAWCSLVTGKYEQAEKYYQKVIGAEGTTASDYANAGHAAWLSGEVGKAATRYQKARALMKSETDDVFAADREFLFSKGLTDDDLGLMTDLLNTNNYSKEQ